MTRRLLMAPAATPVQEAFHAFGTDVALYVWPYPGRERVAAAAMARAVRFLRRAEARLSRFRPDSEIAWLNRGLGVPARVSRLTFDAVAAALAAAQATGGLFDPTVYQALVAAGYDETFDVVAARDPALAPRRSTLNEATSRTRAGATRRGRHRDVQLDPEHLTIQLPAGVGLDLGGIAKGWLADVVVRRLGRHGAALTDLGGDIAVRGLPPDGSAWRVDVAAPDAPDRLLGELLVTPDAGVATSGITRRCWQTQAGLRHHLIDPRTGVPAVSDLLSVTVVAPSAATAEVAAKTALLLGAATGARMLGNAPELAGVLVRQDGRVLTTGAAAWLPAGDGRE